MEELQLPQSDSSVIANLIRHEYQQFDDREEKEISPEALAASVYHQIDPELIAPNLVRHAAILELRELSRRICRQRQILCEQEMEQRNLFELQPRYPATREGRDVYVLREHLTYQEWKENEYRLRQEGQAKIRHADAIGAEVDRLVSCGQLMLPLSEFPGASQTHGAQ